MEPGETLESLHYGLVLDGPEDFFDTEAVWTGVLGDFDVTIENGSLTAKPRSDFKDEIAARAVFQPFIDEWQVKAVLDDSLQLRFKYGGFTVKNEPSPGKPQTFTSRLYPIMEASVGMKTVAYPEPPNEPFALTPFVADLMRTLDEVRGGRQTLPAAAYLLITNITNHYGGDKPSARAINVSRNVLTQTRFLSSMNDPTDRRKVKGQEVRMSNEERRWLHAVLPLLIRQVAKVEAGGPADQLTMADLPPLS